MADATTLDTRQAGTLLVEFEELGGCSLAVERNDADAAGRFRVYHRDARYEIYSNIPGNCARVLQGVIENIDEYLDFPWSRSAELQRLPSGGVAGEWIGLSGGNVTIAGQKVGVAAPCCGILRCTYQTTYDLWQLPEGWSNYAKALVVALCEETAASLGMEPPDEDEEAEDEASEEWNGEDGDSVSFSLTESEAEEEQYYTLRVVDYCTGDPVEGATINTAYGGGTTDADGQIEIGPIPGGRRVDVQVTANGYQSTNSDTLNNDFFQT